VIVTLTPNPSLDLTFELRTLTRGAVLRADATRVEAGGKGVNVARALTANGHPSVAVLPLGGDEGTELSALLAAEGISVVTVPVAGGVRTNVSLEEPDGTVTKINSPGSSLAAAEVEALVVAAVRAARGADWLVCSGSLPPGVPDDLYARLVDLTRRVGAKVAIDSSGAALQEALAMRPDLVKPNRQELAEAVGRDLKTLGEVLEAAQELRRRGAGAVLASLGSDGALFVDADRADYGQAPVDGIRSSVGAGDALLAGFLSVGQGRVPAALAEGLAWAAATTCRPAGSRFPTLDGSDRSSVRLMELVPQMPLWTPTGG
jgi:1-phosphofructokinase